MTTERNSTTVADSEIKYSRLSKDYDIFVGGQYIGSATTYSAAEAIRTMAMAARMLEQRAEEAR